MAIDLFSRPGMTPRCEESSVPRHKLANRVRKAHGILLRIDIARRSFESGVRFQADDDALFALAGLLGVGAHRLGHRLAGHHRG